MIRLDRLTYYYLIVSRNCKFLFLNVSNANSMELSFIEIMGVQFQNANGRKCTRKNVSFLHLYKNLMHDKNSLLIIL